MCAHFTMDKINNIRLFQVITSESGTDILFITNDDIVYGVGHNGSGCLGFGHNKPIKSPQKITELTGQKIKQIVSGNNFTMAINNQQQLYGWGYNDLSQLTNKFYGYRKPGCIEFLKDIKLVQVSCGYYHTMALTIDNQVYGWGCNRFGQIGTGTVCLSVNKPTKLNFGNDIRIESIYCGYHCSFAITDRGKVLCWGFNLSGNLGAGIECDNISAPHMIKNLNNIKCVAMTTSVTYFLSHDGSVYISGEYIDKNKKHYSYEI